MIPALGAGGRGFDSPLAPFAVQAFLAQMVERWPFKPMVVGSIPTEGVTLLVGVVGNISACHADARGSIPRRGALFVTQQRHLGRVVKAVDSKSTGFRPRRFESYRCRLEASLV